MSGLIHTGLGSSSIIAHVVHSPPPPPANSFVIGPAVINTHRPYGSGTTAFSAPVDDRDTVTAQICSTSTSTGGARYWKRNALPGGVHRVEILVHVDGIDDVCESPLAAEAAEELPYAPVPSGKNSQYFHTLGYENVFLQKSDFLHTQKILFQVHTLKNNFIPSKK